MLRLLLFSCFFAPCGHGPRNDVFGQCGCGLAFFIELRMSSTCLRPVLPSRDFFSRRILATTTLFVTRSVCVFFLLLGKVLVLVLIFEKSRSFGFLSPTALFPLSRRNQETRQTPNCNGHWEREQKSAASINKAHTYSSQKRRQQKQTRCARTFERHRTHARARKYARQKAENTAKTTATYPQRKERPAASTKEHDHKKENGLLPCDVLLTPPTTHRTPHTRIGVQNHTLLRTSTKERRPPSIVVPPSTHLQSIRGVFQGSRTPHICLPCDGFPTTVHDLTMFCA